MKIIIEVKENGEITVYTSEPAEVDVVDWKEVKEEQESCPTLYRQLPEQTEKKLMHLTQGCMVAY